jgi:preprotein translocase SecY subunit
VIGYIDALTGGSISKVGLFSLGIVPYINASIVMQLMTVALPNLKRLQRDEGPSGRQKFSQYQKIVTLLFSLVQAIGQLNSTRPFVTEFSLYWLLENSIVLAAGAMILTFAANEIDKFKLGNGTSILIFANILSSLPNSLGATLQQSMGNDPRNTVIFLTTFLVTVLGIVYVQEAERKIPINYASMYSSTPTGTIGRSSYLPFKVNATGVMPIIFASSLLALPSTVARFSDNDLIQKFALSLSPNNFLYTCYDVGLIFFFNYFYTLLQFDPYEVADNLKKSGASLPAVRPGKATAKYLEGTLVRMSVLGSAFLGLLALTPSAVEAATGLTALRGFGGTSILILVGVATDSARRFRAETLMEKYDEIDNYPT